MVEKDVIIIGSGIAGISASIYLKRSNVSFALLDKGAPGGKLNSIHQIDNYAGIPSASGPSLAASLLEQAASLGIAVDYGNVVMISKEEGGFLLTADGEAWKGRSIIIATGLSSRAQTVPGEKERIGRGVSYCATCDGAFFKGKKVAVVGYEDHAVEDALYLSSIVQKVYFIAPKPIKGAQVHVDALKVTENIEIFEDASLLSVSGSPLVDKIVVSNREGEREIEVSGVFPLFGEVPSSASFASLDLKTEKGFIVVDADMGTNVPGVFAAGDIVSKKLRQLITAASDGAIAATSAISYCRSLRKN